MAVVVIVAAAAVLASDVMIAEVLVMARSNTRRSCNRSYVGAHVICLDIKDTYESILSSNFKNAYFHQENR